MKMNLIRLMGTSDYSKKKERAVTELENRKIRMLMHARLAARITEENNNPYKDTLSTKAVPIRISNRTPPPPPSEKKRLPNLKNNHHRKEPMTGGCQGNHTVHIVLPCIECESQQSKYDDGFDDE